MTQVACIQETLKHIHRIAILLQEIIEQLFQRGLKHDLSKLSDPELSSFTKYTPLLKETQYGSKEYYKCLEGMKNAINHHYKNASHHPEHYKHGITEMNLIDIFEMLADWKAASERMKNGNLKNSIIQNQKRFGYSNELRTLLLNTVKQLNW